MTSKKAFKICREKDCKNQQTTLGYCRLHYLKNWRKIQEEQKKKAAVQLNRYIDHIVKRNPENYLDVIKNDLKHPSDFQGHVDDFFVDDEFYTKLDDIDISKEADKVIANLKVDQSF